MASCKDADDLGGMPVVVADLHSALPAIIAGVHASKPDARVVVSGDRRWRSAHRVFAGRARVFVMPGGCTARSRSDSRLAATSRRSPCITGCWRRTTSCRPTSVIVTQGPGNLGTGTQWGFSGVAAGEAINAAGILGGRPIAALRVSEADERPRHRGVSHHSLTAYGRVALVPAEVPIPGAVRRRLARWLRRR